MGKSNPILDTITKVPGMPSHVVVFKSEASKYWWARVYVNKRYHIRSTKTTVMRQAFEIAKKLWKDAEIGVIGSPSQRKPTSLAAVATKMLEVVEKTGKKSRYRNDKSRINKNIIPYFLGKDIADIETLDIAGFIESLDAQNLSPATKKNYLSVLHQIFVHANGQGIINTIPVFPKLNERLTTQNPREWLDVPEYKRLNRKIRALAKEGVKVKKGLLITEELSLLVSFLINSFLRPSDLRVLKHHHVKRVVDKQGGRDWLTLGHPHTKTNAHPVHTMPRAADYYDKLIELRRKNGVSVSSNDYVFYPRYLNRDTLMEYLGKTFRYVVDQSGLRGDENRKICLYSLRHTSVMLRLIKGNIDTLALAKNIRASQQMIEQYYGAHLTPEHTVSQLHSFKTKP